MNTKQLNNPISYTSLNTLTNKNLCVIKYIKEGHSPLLSMTVGDYYIVENTLNAENTHIYTLLNNNIMDSKGTEPIQVYRYINGFDRFVEYEIKGWIEENDLKHANDVNLCPVIANSLSLIYINPLTGKSKPLYNYQYVYPVGLSIDVYKQNLQGRPGYQVLSDNTFGKTDTASRISGIDTITNTVHHDNIALGVMSRKHIAMEGHHKIMVNSVYGMSHGIGQTGTFGLIHRHINPHETDDERERRINHDNGPIQRHACDESIGLNDEYLLIK